MNQICQAMTKTGYPCKAWAVRPAKRSLDGAVAGSDPPRCSALPRSPQLLQSHQLPRSPQYGDWDGDGGRSKPVGAPKGNKNAEKHGYYANTERQRRCSKPLEPLTNLEDIIAYIPRSPQLLQSHQYWDGDAVRYQRLSRLLERALDQPDTDPHEIIRLFHLHGRTASRLGRLHRELPRSPQCGQGAKEINEMARAVSQELDELWHQMREEPLLEPTQETSR